MAVDELTCMAPGKDAGHGKKKRCKGCCCFLAWRLTLIETDGGARAPSVASWTNVYDIEGGRSTSYSCDCEVPLPDRPAAGDGDSSLSAACLIMILALARPG